MIVDLHGHYPMHLVPGWRKATWWRLLRSGRELRRVRGWVRAILVGFASLFANYRTVFSGPRVRVPYMREGGVGVVLSVLYSFFDEVDVAQGTRPHDDYLQSLEDQLRTVEERLGGKHKDVAIVARNPRQLDAAQEADKLAVVHCVEGGFHLGAEPDQVRRAVTRLADHGVAYVTLAHLIWREVATDAPALPFLTDEQYRDLLPQPAEGLSGLGRAAVEAMVAERMLIDVSHMSERSLADTFQLLDELDPDKSVPVLASHVGCRLGTQEYMLARPTLERIAQRRGVVGLIFARHQMLDGIESEQRRSLPGISKRRRLDASFEVLCRHIDCIHEATGSHRYTAIGSDLDGFIKPTLPGLDDMRDMAALEQALRERYGDEDAELICSGNALRMLSAYWRGKVE